MCLISRQKLLFLRVNKNIMQHPDIYKSNIIGPIHSRRLGISLGVNLLPDNGKVCSFDCLYCECGYNEDHRGGHLPNADIVLEQLAHKLEAMKTAGEGLDVITFAGNGEPTMHPQFAYVIDETLKLRDEFFPNAKVSVLSNATRMSVPEVHNALLKVDNNILKIDGGKDETVRMIDRPVDKGYNLHDVVEGMKAFKGELIVQTMFVRGEHDGLRIDNTLPDELALWMDYMRQIKPRQIMVYSLDRPTPEQKLERVTKEEMAELVKPLIEEGFNISIA